MLVVYPLAHVAYHTLYILSVTAPSKAPHSYLAMLGETWMESFKSCMAFGAFEVDEKILVLPVVVLTSLEIHHKWCQCPLQVDLAAPCRMGSGQPSCMVLVLWVGSGYETTCGICDVKINFFHCFCILQLSRWE